MVEEVERLGVDKAWTITGWLDNPLPAIAGGSVFALPSRYESFGYVTLEAMCLGRAIVATDVPGSRDLVVNEQTGILVSDASPSSFAAALERLLRSDALREALGAAARERAMGFTRTEMANRTAEIYQMLAGPAALAQQTQLAC
jgi:glycosyltransferase involved in cell wall biosynthesis